MSVDTEMKSFFDYANEPDGLPDGVYHFRVTETEMRETESGQTYLQIQTEVASGEHVGEFGPRHSWFVPEYREGVSKKTGKPYIITLESQLSELSKQVKAVAGGEDSLSLSNPTVFDETMLEEIGPQLKGREFFATVKRGNDGYADFTRRGFRAIDDPPKGISGIMAAAGFSADEL